MYYSVINYFSLMIFIFLDKQTNKQSQILKKYSFIATMGTTYFHKYIYKFLFLNNWLIFFEQNLNYIK
jgi:hypothetical protein